MKSALLNNRYRMIRALGTGGFGETFLAEDTHMPSRRICVIKQLKPVTHDPHVYQLVQERFQREAAILEQLGEENEQIPKLYAYFAEQGQFYLVQEWVEGATLSQQLQQQGCFSESSVEQLLKSLLAVLEYIHSQGIIHRDIKPSNIILRQRDGKPVLIDFGIAKETMGITVDAQGEITSSIAVGTRGYMPPEQAAGKPVYASDLYSLGLTAIYLLTGKHPENLETHLLTGEVIWDNPPIGAGLKAVLEQAIRSHPRDRYPTAKAMLAALQPQDQAFPSPTETFNPADIETATLAASRPTIGTHNPAYSRQEYRNRQILLNKVKNYWIKGVLETSLHGKALITLGLEKRLDAVDRPWGIVWETPNQPRQTLTQTTKVIELFQQMGAGRTLLILGEPGSGKTTTLLELTRDLIAAAELDSNQPIPVVFNLSAWINEKVAIASWLIRELNTKYQVSQEIGKSWIQNQQLLLLLDGLDEVSPERREACVEAINQFSRDYGSTEIIACSRIKDYEVLSPRLRFQGAIFIQPLTLTQIHHYLTKAGAELAAVANALQADSILQELAKSPLMLSIMALAYQGMSITDLPGMNLEERRQHLFDHYIQRMFDRRGAKEQYSQEQSMRWLTWLAQKLSQQSQSVFLIERMQPNWLAQGWQKKVYQVTLLSIFFLLGGLVGTLLLPVERVLFLLILTGIILWIIVGLKQINPVERLKWSWKKALSNLINGLIIGAILGLSLKLLYDVIFKVVPVHGFWLIFPNLSPFSLVRGMIFGMNIGLIFGLVRGLTAPSIETITVPNQGIWQSAKNALVFGLIAFLVLAIAAKLLGWMVFVWGIFGLSFGLIAGGGEACLKHFVLRLILYHSGYTPWNYARFLDYATERIFLQKVGGGYIFVHRLLLEHFAQMQSD
jgi:serine/threonine protein kinase